MLTLIARWLRGLIAGWLMALMMLLIQRAMKKAFEGAQQNRRTTQPNHPTAGGNVVETIWDGMSAEQLRATFGQPDKREPKGFNREIWTYRTFSNTNNPTEVHIENGAVTHWRPAPLDKIGTN